MTHQLERPDGAELQRAPYQSALQSQFIQSIYSDSKISNDFSNTKCGGFVEFTNPFGDKANPFNRDGYDESKSLGDKIWNGIKKVFGQDETLGEQLEDYVTESKMSEPQRTLLKQQEELYKEEMRRITCMSSLVGAKDFPDIENDERFSMMKLRNDLVKEEKEAIKNEVAEALGPNVMKDVDEASKAFNDAHRIKNPAGTGEGFKNPDADPELEYYWDKIKIAVQKRVESGDSRNAA